MHVIYLVGVPGCGKSTAVRLALDRLGIQPEHHLTPVPHLRFGDVWHLGGLREPFGGTDTLSMSIQPKAIAWLYQLADPVPPYAPTPRILLGEGDRLANNAFLNTCSLVGRLTLIHLDLPLPQARARATARAEALGLTPQNDSWWKGRATKVANLTNSRRTHHWDATQTPDQIADNLNRLLTS